ncbi:MAG: hypothetical protein M1820_003960 [Bogoriella megaspora]|nr:MAG: hypothetical protein M1820_003960 [Bogoriella megaspora]
MNIPSFNPMFLFCLFASTLIATVSAEYINWKTFNATGVNLGGWLEQEQAIDTAWWATYSGGAQNEWELCANLGSDCGPVLEQRYETYITTEDIDKLAAGGVNVLRVPTTYAAWVKVPGSQLYTGNQPAIMKKILDHAIEKYGMHIILDIHLLPVGVNALGSEEEVFQYGWFFNETAWNYSMQAVDAVLSFIINSGSPESYTIAPINEPADNPNVLAFASPAALTEDGAAWLSKYYNAVLARIAAVDSRIPLMLEDGFKGEEYWSSKFPNNTNIVFDIHHYYFVNPLATAENLPTFICSDAKSSAGDGKFPVFIGEWCIQTLFGNSFSFRKQNVNAGLHAFSKYASGSSYWTAKYLGNGTVLGEGTQEDYWNFETFIDLDYINPSDGAAYC